MFGHHSSFRSAIALSSTLAVSMVITMPAAAQARFLDVNNSYWASDYVQALTEAKRARLETEIQLRETYLREVNRE